MFTILVVDKNTKDRQFIKKGLERANFIVREEATMTNAHQQIQTQPPDLVILGLEVPEEEEDGLAFLKLLKSSLTTQDLPVLILASKLTDAMIFAAWRENSDCTLEKSPNSDQVISFVKRIFKSLEKEADSAE